MDPPNFDGTEAHTIVHWLLTAEQYDSNGVVRHILFARQDFKGVLLCPYGERKDVPVQGNQYANDLNHVSAADQQSTLL